MRLGMTSCGLSGAFTLLILAACSGGVESTGSKYVASAVIGPAGGSISISASDDATLAGTVIKIPANAVAAGTTISIGLATTSSVTPKGGTTAGPVLDFEPSGTVFKVPVTITIPTTAAGDSAFVEAVEADGSETKLVATVSGGLATFQANGFTNFGAWTSAVDAGPPDTCATDNDCISNGLGGFTCVDGACVSTTPATDAGVDADGSCSTDNDCISNGLGGFTCVDGRCEAIPPTDAGADVVTVNDADAAFIDAAPIDGGPAPCETNADCGAGGTCVDNVCQTGDAAVCSDVECSGVCVDLSSDNANCGACGQACEAGSTCQDGVCTT